MRGKVFGIIGGDSRQKYLTQFLAADGFKVKVFGIDDVKESSKVKKESLDDLVKHSDYVVLPIPVSKDGINIYAPYSTYDILMDENFFKICAKSVIFCSGKNKLMDRYGSILNNTQVFDYISNETFAIENALPTAEGAIGIAINEFDGVLSKAKCLIVGFGNIGKVLAGKLKSWGSDVTVSARKDFDFAWIEALGYRVCHTNSLNGKYDIVFNTVPHLVLDEKFLCGCCGDDTLIIDLASQPGGVDYYFAEKTGVKCIHALALPGKIAPAFSGEIVKKSIYKLIKENDL